MSDRFFGSRRLFCISCSAGNWLGTDFGYQGQSEKVQGSGEVEQSCPTHCRGQSELLNEKKSRCQCSCKCTQRVDGIHRGMHPCCITQRLRKPSGKKWN